MHKRVRLSTVAILEAAEESARDTALEQRAVHHARHRRIARIGGVHARVLHREKVAIAPIVIAKEAARWIRVLATGAAVRWQRQIAAAEGAEYVDDMAVR